MSEESSQQSRRESLANSFRKSQRQEIFWANRKFYNDYQEKGFRDYVAYLIDNLRGGYEPQNTTVWIGYLIRIVDSNDKLASFSHLLDVLFDLAETTTDIEVMQTTLSTLASASENTKICELLNQRGIINWIFRLAAWRKRLLSTCAIHAIFRIHIEVEDTRKSLNESPIFKTFSLTQLFLNLCFEDQNIAAAVKQVKQLFLFQNGKVPVSLILSLAIDESIIAPEIIIDKSIQQDLILLMFSKFETLRTKQLIFFIIHKVAIMCTPQVLLRFRDFIPYMFEVIRIEKDWHLIEIALTVLINFLDQRVQIHDVFEDTVILLDLLDERQPHQELGNVVLYLLRRARRPKKDLLYQDLHLKIQAKLGRCKQLIKEVKECLAKDDEEMEDS